MSAIPKKNRNVAIFPISNLQVRHATRRWGAWLGVLALAWAPLEAATPSRLKNPGFEDGLSRWSLPAARLGEIGAVAATEEAARSGRRSLRLDTSIPRERGGPTTMLFQTIHGIEPGAIYYLTGWAKGGEGGRGSIRAAIKLEYYNAEGRNTTGVNGYQSLLANGEWTRVQAVARADVDTTHVKIYARNMERKAVVFFDDFEFSQPDVVILEPTRLTHLPGRESQVTLKVWTRDPLSAEARPEIIATHEEREQRLPAKVREIGERTYELSTTLPAIERGFYQLNVALGEERSPVVARTFETIAQRKPESLSDMGAILHNGKPFFPIGIYHPQNHTWYRLGATTNDVEGVVEDYRRLAEMGFNAVQGNATRNLDRLGRFLDEAHRHGLAVDVPLYEGGQVRRNLSNSLEKIHRFKDHPAVLNWKISDEPDLKPSVIDEVPEAYLAFKKADPGNPVEITLATDYALDGWSQFADIIQINRYPLPGGALTRVSEYTRLAVEQKQPWQNVSYVVQSGWGKEGTVPTRDELRSMIYLALIEGAKGIWYYTMYDPGFDLSQTPIWPHLKEINAEIAALSEPVMLGKHEPNATLDNPQLFSRAVEHEGRLYLLLTNPERSAQKARLSLPARWASTPVHTLEGEPAEIPAELVFAPVESRTLIFGPPRP